MVNKLKFLFWNEGDTQDTQVKFYFITEEE